MSVKIKKLRGGNKFSINGILAVIEYSSFKRPGKEGMRIIKYSSELSEHESKIFKGYLSENKII